MNATAPRPFVHLNGTSRKELVRQKVDIYDAICKAQEALCMAAPHMRDYYPMQDAHEQYEAALLVHRNRWRSLEELKEELVREAEAIQDA